MEKRGIAAEDAQDRMLWRRDLGSRWTLYIDRERERERSYVQTIGRKYTHFEFS
jgi:hypothetical protein